MQIPLWILAPDQLRSNKFLDLLIPYSLEVRENDQSELRAL